MVVYILYSTKSAIVSCISAVKYKTITDWHADNQEIRINVFCQVTFPTGTKYQRTVFLRIFADLFLNFSAVNFKYNICRPQFGNLSKLFYNAFPELFRRVVNNILALRDDSKFI